MTKAIASTASERVVIGLGGNVGAHDEILARFISARAALAALGPLRSAPLYRTAPIGEVIQSPFLNTAVAIALDAAIPAELIATVLEIERLLGRDRSREQRRGPRKIDLDVLLWGTRIVDTAELEVPHPRLAERKFALAPLVDLVGDDLMIPGAAASIGILLQRVASQPCEQIASTW